MSSDFSCFNSFKKFQGFEYNNHPLKQDDKTVNFNSRVQTVSQLLPQSRKLVNCCNYLNTGCYLYAAGNGIRFVNEIGPDWQDVKDIFCKKNHDPEWQKPIRLIEGTLIQKTKIGEFLLDYDKTLFDFKFVKKLLVKIGMQRIKENNNKIKIEGSIPARFFGKASSRISVLGVGAFEIMQLDGVIKVKSNKERLIELAKGMIYD